MKRDRIKIDLVSIERNTRNQKYWIEEMTSRMRMINEDKEKKQRLEISECVLCYQPYGSGRQGGAACTSINCALCDEVITCGNTSIDILCLECAKHEKLCKHCGADVELKYRKSRKQPEFNSLNK